MAFVSFEMVQQILKRCEGKTFMEAMDSVASSHVLDDGRIKIDTDDRGCVTKVAVLNMGAGYMLSDLPDDPKIITPSIPQTSEADRMWNLVVLAAQASRYGDG
jgi:hypothetical protein